MGDMDGTSFSPARIPARPITEVHTAAELDAARREDQEARARIDQEPDVPKTMEEYRLDALSRLDWAERNLPAGDQVLRLIAESTRMILELVEEAEAEGRMPSDENPFPKMRLVSWLP